MTIILAFKLFKARTLLLFSHHLHSMGISNDQLNRQLNWKEQGAS